MNYIDHLLRERMLDSASGASITLTEGAAQPLYPEVNLYNGRVGIPLITTDDKLVIDVDLGASELISAVSLLGINAVVLGSSSVNLKAGTVFGTWIYDRDYSPFGTADPISDLFSTAFLYNAAWVAPGEYRYWRITVDQPDRITEYTRIGELWFEPAGSHSWWENYEAGDISASWPGIDQPVIGGKEKTAFRGMGISMEIKLRAAGRATAFSLIESAIRRPTLCNNWPFDYFGAFDSLSFRNVSPDQYQGRLGARVIVQTFAGSAESAFGGY